MTPPVESTTPINDSVICPNCVHQFVAIPLSVQECIWQLERDNAELRAALEKAKEWNGHFAAAADVFRADAERYRWLRKEPATIHFDREIAFVPRNASAPIYVHMIGNTELDAAIDAAISTDQPPVGER